MKILASFVFLLTALLCFAAHAEPEVDKPTPALAAQELDGTAFDLGAMRGKIVVVHFWATWCPSCREEMTVLEQFSQAYHARGIEVIGITLDKPRARTDVLAFMKPFTFPTAMISDVEKNGFGTPPAVPATYMIDRNGTLRARFTPEDDPLTMKLLEKTVKSFLAPSLSPAS